VIGRLRGELVAKEPPHLMIDAGGVGYELEAPMSTFCHLPAVGESVVLLTHLVVREDAQLLYGFLTEAERALFRHLIRVSGVGARTALAILSGMSVEEFRRCVHGGDAQGLTRLPGIGRKTAERLVVEMRDRLAGLPAAQAGVVAAAPPATPTEDAAAEAVRALVSLGYKEAAAERMVRAVAGPDLRSEDLIRLALKRSLA